MDTAPVLEGDSRTVKALVDGCMFSGEIELSGCKCSGAGRVDERTMYGNAPGAVMIQLKRFNNADVVVQGGSSEWQKQTSRAYNQKVKMQEKLDLSTHCERSTANTRSCSGASRSTKPT